jgi:hypothetical protein
LLGDFFFFLKKNCLAFHYLFIFYLFCLKIFLDFCSYIYLEYVIIPFIYFSFLFFLFIYLFCKNETHARVSLSSNTTNCSSNTPNRWLYSVMENSVVSFNISNLNSGFLLLDLVSPLTVDANITVNDVKTSVKRGTTQIVLPVQNVSSFSISEENLTFQTGLDSCGSYNFGGEFHCEPKLKVVSIWGDLNDDLLVNGDDLNIVRSFWGNNCSDNCIADVDQSGVVDIFDIVQVLDFWKSE